jgi:hypothetical protein
VPCHVDYAHEVGVSLSAEVLDVDVPDRGNVGVSFVTLIY